MQFRPTISPSEDAARGKLGHRLHLRPATSLNTPVLEDLATPTCSALWAETCAAAGATAFNSGSAKVSSSKTCQSLPYLQQRQVGKQLEPRLLHFYDEHATLPPAKQSSLKSQHTQPSPVTNLLLVKLLLHPSAVAPSHTALVILEAQPRHISIPPVKIYHKS